MKTMCAAALALLVGCAAQSVEPDPEQCSLVDRACPDSMPSGGAPCEGDLSCTYPETVASTCPPVTCVDGRWQIACILDGPPALAERCRDPHTAEVDGVSFELRGLSTAVEWGLQGGAMIAYTLDAIPGEEAPSCVRVHTTVEVDGVSETTVHDVRLRCGASQRVLEILPILPCELRDYEVHLRVEVEGLGERAADLVLAGGPSGGFPPVCE